MKDQLDKIEAKVEKIEDSISNIDVTLARQAKDLEHHIYRTSLAEENIELLRTELQPVKKHVALVDAGLKLVGALASATAFVLGVVKILFG
jgi:predicted  nucleic acid-binding Zn-ribbon protein